MNCYSNNHTNNVLFLNLNITAGKKVFYSDIIFFMVVVVIPSSFFGLVNDSVFYVRGLFDLIFFSWVICLPYILIYHYNIRKINCYKWGKALIVLSFFLCTNYYISIVKDIDLTETIKIFRYFWFPIAAFAILLRVFSMDSYRIVRFFNWIIISMTIQGVFYIVFHLTGFNIFSQDIYLQVDLNGSNVYRYFKALPMFGNIVFYVTTVTLINRRETVITNIIPLLVSIVCLLLSSTRSSLLTSVIFIVIAVCLTMKFQRTLNIGRISKLLLVLFVSAGVFFIFFPNYLAYFADRFSELNQSESMDSVVNFKARIDLIKEAFNSHETLLDFFCGKGYKRHGVYMEYDFVLGGDTHIAPVLFCEGFLGLILRFMPILSLLLINFRRLYNQNIDRTIPILIISVIISEFFNIIQTTIFKNYTVITIFLFMLDILYRRVFDSLQKVDEDIVEKGFDKNYELL